MYEDTEHSEEVEVVIHEATNTGKKWETWQLREILRDVPTKQNVERWSRVFKRGEGGIALVYKWAYTPRWKIDLLEDEGDGRYSFANRVWGIKKELGIII